MAESIGNVGVSIEELRDTYDVLTTSRTDMSRKLEAIFDGVTNLRNSWKSPASERLRDIANVMNDRFTELGEVVDSFATFLNGIIENYEANETEQNELLSSIVGSLSTN